MLKFLSPEKAANASARHPWYVLGIWAVIIGLAFAGASIKKVNHSVEPNTRTESGLAAQQLKQARGADVATETVVVSSERDTASSPAFQSYVQDLTGKLRGLNGTVATAASYYD